jgi:hypothetical protein
MIATALSNILKLFLPSWNFFNDFSTVQRLDIRAISAEKETDWQAAFSNETNQSFSRVFFNARGNLELLQHSYIDRAASWFNPDSKQTAKQFEATNHHRLLAIITRDQLAAIPDAKRFQFRLVVTNSGSPDQVLFTSQEFSMEESR